MLAFSMPLYIISRREHGESWHVSASSGGIVKLKRAETERRGGGEGWEGTLIYVFLNVNYYMKKHFFSKKKNDFIIKCTFLFLIM